jgi:hypothetical protein
MNMNNDKPSPETGQTTGPSRRTIAARENGSEGGRKRASQFSWDVLSEWASHGGKAVLAKYGPDCFAGLRKRGKNYPKLNESPVVEPNWRKIVAWENGQEGGLARAARYSPECFREWGRIWGIETWVRHGRSSIARSEKIGSTTRRTT